MTKHCDSNIKIGYSTKQVIEKLKERGYDISERTINYYVFDKKMFPIDSGKNSFTENEIDKIEAIILYKKHTDMTLNEIKEKINQSSFYLKDTVDFCANNTIQSIQSYYTREAYGLSSSVNSIYKASIPEISCVTNTDFGSCSYNRTEVDNYKDGLLKSNFDQNNSLNSRLNKQNTIKINNSITLITANNISDSKITQIIKSINNILKE